MKRRIFGSSSITSTTLVGLFITIGLGGFRAIATRDGVRIDRVVLAPCPAPSPGCRQRQTTQLDQFARIVPQHRGSNRAKLRLLLPTQPSLIVPRRESTRFHRFSIGDRRPSYSQK